MAKTQHKHGTMKIDAQEKTFEGFIKWSAYVAIGSLAFLAFIAMVNG